MTQSAHRPDPSAAEWQLLETLRALPDEALRHRMIHAVRELAFFFQNPRCQGIGVEGFPCGDPQGVCDECHQVWNLLDRLAERNRER